MNKKLLSAFFAPLLVGIAVNGFLVEHYTSQVKSLQSATKRQLRDVALDEATAQLTKVGCSNFSVMLISEHGDEQRAAMIESNRIYLNVGFTEKFYTNSGTPIVQKL
jgi:hypothetical protein